MNYEEMLQFIEKDYYYHLELPIIDYSSSREINKEKVLSLHL